MEPTQVALGNRWQESWEIGARYVRQRQLFEANNDIVPRTNPSASLTGSKFGGLNELLLTCFGTREFVPPKGPQNGVNPPCCRLARIARLLAKSVAKVGPGNLLSSLSSAFFWSTSRLKSTRHTMINYPIKLRLPIQNTVIIPSCRSIPHKHRQGGVSKARAMPTLLFVLFHHAPSSIYTEP